VLNYLKTFRNLNTCVSLQFKECKDVVIVQVGKSVHFSFDESAVGRCAIFSMTSLQERESGSIPRTRRKAGGLYGQMTGRDWPAGLRAGEQVPLRPVVRRSPSTILPVFRSGDKPTDRPRRQRSAGCSCPALRRRRPVVGELS